MVAVGGMLIGKSYYRNAIVWVGDSSRYAGAVFRL